LAEATPASRSRQRSGAESTCHAAQQVELVVVAEVGVALQHAPRGGAQSLGDAQQLGVGRGQAGSEAAVLGPMLGGARGAEAQRARPDGLGGQPAHLGDLVRGGGLGVVGGPVAHDVEAQRGVRHLRPDVHHPLGGVEGVEVLAEALPTEVDALGQHRAGDVLDPLHQVDEEVLRAGAHRGEPHRAVAEHRGGDAVPRRGGELRVPRGLAVVVGVDVDPARHHHMPLGVDLAVAPGVGRARRADRHDAAAVERQVAHHRRGPGAVDHQPVADHQLGHVALPSASAPRYPGTDRDARA
jgi:hypothetical protein